MCLYLFIFFLQKNPEQYCCKNRVLKCDKYRLENALLSSTRNFDQKRLGKRTEGLRMLWVLSFRAKNRCIYQLRDSFIFIVRCWQLHMIIRKPCHTKLVRRNNPKKISGDFSNLVIPILFSEIFRRFLGVHVMTLEKTPPYQTNRCSACWRMHGDLTIPWSLTKFDSGSLAVPSCSFHAENKIGKRERK